MKTFSLPRMPLKAAFASFVGVAALVSAPGHVQAANPITITGQTNPAENGTYTVDFITGDWATVQATLASQKWWGNSNLAGSLAGALMGSPTPPAGSIITNTFQNSGVGPIITTNLLFATDAATIFPPANIPVVNGQTSLSPFNGSALNFQVLQNSSYNWAVATFVPAPGAPVPGPLPLVGAAAAFGFSRRLRSRINKSATA
jgi:hypothetical protein